MKKTLLILLALLVFSCELSKDDEKKEEVPKIILSKTTIDEGNQIGDTIGVFSIEGIEDDSNIDFTLTGTSNDISSFEISGKNLNAKEVFNFSEKNSYSIKVKVIYGDLIVTEDFTITISEVEGNNENGNQVDPIINDYTVTTITNKKLLSNNINELSVGPNGLLYIATNGGLSIYNGSNWTNYPYSTIEDVAVTSNGIIYVISGGKLYYLNNDEWVYRFVGAGNLTSMHIDEFDKIYLGSSDYGIYVGELTGDFANYTSTFDDQVLSSNQVSDIYAESGNIYVAHKDSVTVYSAEDDTWTDHYDNLLNFRLDYGFHAIYAEGLDNIQLAAGPRHAHYEVGDLIEFNGTSWNGHNLGGKVLHSISGGNGKLYAGSKEGIYAYNGSSWEKYTEDGYFTKADRASGWIQVNNTKYDTDFTYAAAYDKSSNKAYYGSIWGGGLTILSNSTVENILPETLLSKYVYDIDIAPNGEIAFAFFGHGVTIKNELGYKQFYNFNSGIELAAQTYSVNYGPDNKLYVGSSGLRVFDGTDWEIYEFETHLKSSNVFSTLVTGSGEIYAAHGTYRGISYFDGSSWSTISEFDNISVNVLIEENNKIYAGTDDGLYIYDGQTWEKDQTFEDLGLNVKRMSEMDVKDGNVLVVVNEDSLYFKGPSNEWTSYLDITGLVPNSLHRHGIRGVAIGENSTLYAVANDGLYVKKSGEDMQKVTDADGICTNPSDIEINSRGEVIVAGDGYTILTLK